jgi:hypothetical protein
MLLGLALAWALPADAVIKVDFPVTMIYEASKTVVVGTVAAINPANGVVTAKVTDTAKGDPYGDTYRAQIVALPAILAQVAAGQPIVLFQAKDKNGTIALIHLADTWLMAELIANATPPAWRITQIHDAKQTYPGRTVALAQLVAEMKAGKPSLLNKAEPGALRGPIKLLATLKVAKPLFLIAADLNGDKKPDLLVGAAGGVKLFLATADGFEDATEKWGLAGAAGPCAAFGDANGDGKPDLLLGTTLYINEGTKFTAAKADTFALATGEPPAAVALADVSGKKRTDAVILLANGQCIVLENPGAPGKPWTAQAPRNLWKEAAPPLFAAFGDWGDIGKACVLAVRGDGVTRYALDADGGAPADYERLTGEQLGAHFKTGNLKGVVATALDVNADKRADLFLVAGGAPLLLVNRNLGCFFVDPDAGSCLGPEAKTPPPFKVATGMAMSAADLRGDGYQDVLVLTEDGKLYDVANPPPAK